LGLQASSRLSKRIRRLNLGRDVVPVIVEELIEVEVVVKEAVVVTIHMIKVKIDVVGEREEPVVKDEVI